MARLSLWNPKKGNDYKFIDKLFLFSRNKEQIK